MNTQRIFEVLSAVLASIGAVAFAGLGPDMPAGVVFVTMATALCLAVLATVRAFGLGGGEN